MLVVPTLLFHARITHGVFHIVGHIGTRIPVHTSSVTSSPFPDYFAVLMAPSGFRSRDIVHRRNSGKLLRLRVLRNRTVFSKVGRARSGLVCFGERCITQTESGASTKPYLMNSVC